MKINFNHIVELFCQSSLDGQTYISIFHYIYHISDNISIEIICFFNEHRVKINIDNIKYAIQNMNLQCIYLLDHTIVDLQGNLKFLREPLCNVAGLDQTRVSHSYYQFSYLPNE